MVQLQPDPATPIAAADGTSPVAWLKQIPLFSDVDSESLALFVSAMSAREFQPGEAIFRQGDASCDVYLVTRGDTEIRIEQDGRVAATDKVQAGSCVGEMAALTGKPRSATVTAGSQGASVLVIPGSRFRDLLLLQPSLGVNMLAMMSERLRQTELRKQHAALARRAEELGKSKEAADATLRARADLLASMSHELRTPLNGIIGLTEIVLGTSLTYSQREYLNLVRESGESLLALINDVLDMSKIEAGRLQLEIVPFELRDSLIETLKTLAVRAHGKGVELACRVGPDVPDRLLGDLPKLRQIVVNLVGNAVKFTEQGEVVVEVTCPRRTTQAVTLQVTVRDTGIGISKEALAQLFRPYAQADASIARRFGGTGLGLSISARLVEGMQGRIWVDSTVGVGSEFHFCVELQMDRSKENSVLPAGQSALAGKRALLIQPLATTARILEEMLSGWGLEVVTVVNGAEGAKEAENAAVKGRPYSCLLMDIRIPDSVTWIEKIREGKSLAPVMLLTADKAAEGTRCEELRIPHLLQPVKPSELLNALMAASLTKTPAEQVLPAEAAGIQAATPTALPPGRKILLVEDGLIHQKVAQSLLSKKGYQVTIATTGKEAIAALQREPFDLVLMDVMMPEMDGIEATRAIRLREQETGEHLPIIAMTASNAPQDTQSCLTAGMDAFVSKPIRQEHLFATLDEFLTGPRAPQSKKRDEAVDWSEVLRQAGGRRELLEERVALLLQEFPRVRQDLFTAAAEGDSSSLRIAAHTIKVALGTFGAQRLANLALQLEEAARANDKNRENELVSQFRPESEQFVAALQSFRGANTL